MPESNQQAFQRQILSLLCLPISPIEHSARSREGSFRKGVRALAAEVLLDYPLRVHDYFKNRSLQIVELS